MTTPGKIGVNSAPTNIPAPFGVVDAVHRIDVLRAELAGKRAGMIEGAASALGVPAGWTFNGRDFVPPASAEQAQE